jgi:hypothetical protein
MVRFSIINILNIIFANNALEVMKGVKDGVDEYQSSLPDEGGYGSS